MMKLDRYPKDSEGRVSALSTAIMHEAVELQRTTNWKWWKTPTEFNQAEAREESFIDIWHFVVQASLELNLSPDDIVDEYKEKMRSTEKDKETVIEETLSFFHN